MCMCVYVYVCLCVCVHVFVFVRVCLYVRACVDSVVQLTIAPLAASSIVLSVHVFE